mmetsp:Transcript_4436/g.12547  ORF Transcript_4436/g.12547 Transcript_4436/m.12547 type:complete len:99 (-) Transcript_4436:690-986(-)
MNHSPTAQSKYVAANKCSPPSLHHISQTASPAPRSDEPSQHCKEQDCRCWSCELGAAEESDARLREHDEIFRKRRPRLGRDTSTDHHVALAVQSDELP